MTRYVVLEVDDTGEPCDSQSVEVCDARGAVELCRSLASEEGQWRVFELREVTE